MASLQQSAFLLLFLVLFRVTNSSPIILLINSTNYEKAGFLSRFAVDQYNKKGESHLIFQEFVNGTLVYFPYKRSPLWVLQLNAKNCSEPGTPTALYVAPVAENAVEGSQIEAYGSTFYYLNLMKF